MLQLEMLKQKGILIFVLFITLIQCSSHQVESPSNILLKRELRGAWITTVSNIDWPSKKGLSSDRQQKEFIDIVNHHQRLGINALFVQVRTASDAFYSVSPEPWSVWLSGQQGIPPSPYYDPMQFMIEHAHERNMEFHAWLNLNRGTMSPNSSVASNHVTKTHPEWFLTYKGTKIYNFGIPEVRDYIIKVVMNIVKNYDVDGIHFDDYFYPYPTPGQRINDEDTYRKYGRSFRSIEDWRRNNVNELIRDLSNAIKKEKPWVKFGISPFGVWRNRDKDREGSNTIGALSSYDDLYADSRLWAQEGWVDYIAPQIYWSFTNRTVAYQPMVDWWVKNSGNRHLYIGIATYRVGENNKDWASADQIVQQIEYNNYNTGVDGSIFYNTKSILPSNNGVSRSIAQYYSYPALPPTMPWKKADPIPKPEITELIRHQSGSKVRIRWETPAEYEEYVRSFIIYRFNKGQTRNIENPENILAIVRNKDLKQFIDDKVEPNGEYEYAVAALDRLWNEGKPSKLHKLYLE